MADQRTTDDAGTPLSNTAPLRDITPVCDTPLVPRRLLYSGIAIIAVVIVAVIAISV
ncbi:MAG: hypothetical protein IIC93_05505 [Chloroflexi bacterium]|nr:hypothetical protein [Chloroflexota bacterium]